MTACASVKTVPSGALVRCFKTRGQMRGASSSRQSVNLASVNVNGQPGFISRKAETTVLLRNGQSFAIAGLLQSNNARGSDQVPWLGQLPVIGALFSSREFQKRETDLVILVTPRLVQPATPDAQLASPLDETVPSNDVELFLLGMLEVDNQLLTRFREGRGAPGPYGHIIELEFEDGIIKK
jgi:pilus assembly protein CpaC